MKSIRKGNFLVIMPGLICAEYLFKITKWSAVDEFPHVCSYAIFQLIPKIIKIQAISICYLLQTRLLICTYIVQDILMLKRRIIKLSMLLLHMFVQ